MREHRARSEQAETVIDVEIGARLGEQLLHPRDLVEILGEVGLHPEAGRLGIQAPDHRELLRAGGRREARRQRVAEPRLAVPALDEFAAVPLGARHVIAQIVRAVAVHQDLAADHAQIAPLGFLEEGVDRLLVHGRIDRGGGGAVAQQRVEEQPGDLAPMLRIGEGALRREGVVVEPVEQLPAVGGDDVDLRVMHMGVDEARQDQLAAVVVQRVLRGARFQDVRRGPTRGDAAIDDLQAAVIEIFPRAGSGSAPGSRRKCRIAPRR